MVHVQALTEGSELHCCLGSRTVRTVVKRTCALVINETVARVVSLWISSRVSCAVAHAAPGCHAEGKTFRNSLHKVSSADARRVEISRLDAARKAPYLSATTALADKSSASHEAKFPKG